MMTRLRTILVLLLPWFSLFLAGCGSLYITKNTHQAPNVTPSQVAYIYVIGTTTGKTLKLDKQRFDLQDMPSFKLDGQTVVTFQTSIGKHQVEVFHHHRLLVQTTFSTQPNHTFQLDMPPTSTQLMASTPMSQVVY